MHKCKYCRNKINHLPSSQHPGDCDGNKSHHNGPDWGREYEKDGGNEVDGFYLHEPETICRLRLASNMARAAGVESQPAHSRHGRYSQT